MHSLSASFYLALVVLGFSLNSNADERPVYGISQSLHAKLQQVDQLLAPPPNIQDFQADFALALQLTQEIMQECRRCNPYEYATLYRYLAWLSFQNDELASTITNYESIVALSPEIPVAFEQEALLALTKIYFQEENYARALQRLSTWKRLAADIPSEIYELQARIEYVMENHPAALDNISRAIEISEQNGDIPAETWLLFQRNLFYNIEDFTACLSVQRKLVEHYCKDAHWRDLAVFYGLLGEQAYQIAAFDTAWLMQGLFKENDILNFAWLLQNADYPYKAALDILNRGIALVALRRFDEAESAFRLAMADDSTAETARKWLSHSQKEHLLHQQLSLLVN